MNDFDIKPKPSKSYTICLNMIVKNESHIITKTLENITSYIDFDAYFISDTGSTDNTMELIREFFIKKNIPGHIEQVEWKDFGFNRTLALQMAFNKTDYLFIFDADDTIHGDFRMPRVLTHDAYQLKLGESFVYLRTLIVNNRKRWRYVGVLHEYIACVDKEESSHAIEGNYYVESGRVGSRNQDPNKYIKDAEVLERGYREELANDLNGVVMGNGGGGRSLAERYAFYCAQSWMDAGPAYIDKAIEWYLRVLSQNNWSQEKYYSALCLGNLYYKKGDKYNSLKYYCATMEYDEERIEGVASLMENLRADGNHMMVNALYHKYKNYNKYPQNKLFLSTDKYHDIIEYNNSISAFYISDKRSGYECCKTILRHNIMPFHYMSSTYSNFVFYRNFFEEESYPELLRLFFIVDHFLSVIASKNDTFNDDDIETWNRLFFKVKDSLIAPCVMTTATATATTATPDEVLDKACDVFHLSRSVEKLAYLDKNIPTIQMNEASRNITVLRNRISPRVIITFTTCKRLDLFQQTVNSILNMWSDIHKIDYWFCVDDNSSETDRNQMKTLYPWIDYYMKNVSEKGHRPSMKIIWNKLNELRPDYWIHMEDDFLFHTPGSYIDKATQMMTDARNSGYNVRQILYNRNYGETIEDYKIQGHRMLRRMRHDVALHQHKHVGEDVGYRNCHYWPHYSFRPSIIDVDAILSVGNYDTPNQFFEMDYANKWTQLGFLSGFYNHITNRHIGRLTSERNDKTQPNAYELNDESQFVALASPSASSSTIPDANVPDTIPLSVIQNEELSKTIIKPKKYISSLPFDDGFGAQYQRFIWTCIYAEEYEDAIFVYKSPVKIAHNYTAEPQFVDKMENIMNMKPHYTNHKDICYDERLTIITPDFYDVFNYVEKNIDACMKSKSMRRIKEYYWQNKNRNNERLRLFRIKDSSSASLSSSESSANVYTHHLALHMRRPNCDDTRPNGGEEYTNEYYIRSLLNIRGTYLKYDANYKIQFHIYSQGNLDNFTNIYTHPIIGKDVMMHLDDNTEDTFVGMTVADILVTSASSYSYVAAFLSDGDIYYTDFWHKPCSWWNKLEK